LTIPLEAQENHLAQAITLAVTERPAGEKAFNHHPGQTKVDAAGFSNDIVSFDQKHITLEVFGEPGTVATINYLDINVQPQQVVNASLPWSVTMVTTQPGAFTNLVAQGNSGSLGCRITVDGEVKDERTVNEVNAYTYCIVKSA
jgi:hypothetical protein